MTVLQVSAVPPMRSKSSRIPHYRKLSDRIHCGAEPVTREHFRRLQELGVRHIISVDGAPPNLKSAAHYGLQYTHIPFGYDGVPPQAYLAITRAVRELKGPIFIHCHHGKHRGPAAAAIACRVEGTADRARAAAILRESGTSPDYAGLWASVREFERPPASQTLPALKPTRKVPPMAQAMARIARQLDRFEKASAAERPQAAILIYEGLRESHRLQTSLHTKEFQNWMAGSRDLARRLYDASREDETTVPTALAALRTSCTNCHAAYRN